MQTYKSYEYNYDVLTSRLKLLLLMWGWRLLWSRLPPAEGVEHPEEGDRHIDEDDQGEQGVGDTGVGTNSKSEQYLEDGMINVFFLLVSRDLYWSVWNVLNMSQCFTKEYPNLKAYLSPLFHPFQIINNCVKILTAWTPRQNWLQDMIKV